MTATRQATSREGRALDAADALVRFLETGRAEPGLFAANVFCDLTLPTWRLQAAGRDAVIALRLDSHPMTGTVNANRIDILENGFLIEFEERWHQTARTGTAVS